MIEKNINRINKTELKNKGGEGGRLNVRKYFLVVRVSLCKADRQGDAVGCGVKAFTTSLGRLSLRRF